MAVLADNPMGASLYDDDDFDWDAALLAVSNEMNLSRIPNQCKTSSSVKPQSGSNALGKSHQKTLLNFLQVKHPKPSKFKDGETLNFIESLDNETGVNNIDVAAAKTWIYPVNVPMRSYQHSIVQTALFANTLVSLPTGLGKTLIAAVVMYNFFRWFPTGKIVFTAPSRPLVMQQIEACHNIVGISQEWTIDLTGQVHPAKRSMYWETKRVFFVTPQVLEKDIESGSFPMKHLVCLVVDEAHRASGNYAYCIIVQKLMEMSIRLRILALTATPGCKQSNIQAVIDKLRISCLEYRNENDPDVRAYIHKREVELIEVKMTAESSRLKDAFLEILQPPVDRLCSFGVFYSRDATRLAAFEFITARDKFRQAPPAGLDNRQLGEIEACFGLTITLYHIFKLVFSHGVRPAYEMLRQKLQSGLFARLMARNEKVHQLKLMMQQCLGDGTSSPKMSKMLKVISQHFESHNPATSRIIIFTNFRESVRDILDALKSLGSDVNARDFIGQSSGKSSKGQSQKIQAAVLQSFRTGTCNVIVATSIAEEGLDIMEVDLVICFDANVSPLRMVQRMGRTGRKRDGRVVVLASEGSELQGYLRKQEKTNIVGKHMRDCFKSFSFHSSPRMVPHLFRPQPQLIELAIKKFIGHGGRKKRSGLDEHSDPVSADLTEAELTILRRYFDPMQKATWKPSLIAFPQFQLFPTHIYQVKHSFRTTSLFIDTIQAFHGDTPAEHTGFQNHVISADDATCQNVQEKQVQDNQNDDIIEFNLSNPIVKLPPGRSGDVLSPSKEQSDVQAAENNSVSNEDHANDKKQAIDFHTIHYPQHQVLNKIYPVILENGPPNATQHVDCVSPSQAETNNSDYARNYLVLNKSHAVLEKQEKDVETDLLVQSQQVWKSCNSPAKDRGSTQAHSEEKSIKDSLHCCLFSEEIVRVGLDGHVIISSPPNLPLLDTEHYWGKHRGSHSQCNWSGQEINVLPKLSCIERKNQLGAAIPEVENCDSPNSHLFHGRIKDLAETQLPASSDCIACTPEERIRRNAGGLVESSTFQNLDDLSPRLNNLAENGFIPASPVQVQPSTIDHSASIKTNRYPVLNLLSCEVKAETPTPEQGCKSISNNWHLTCTDAAASVHKPRSYKRLQKAKARHSATLRVSNKNPANSTGKHNPGKQQRSLLVREYIDDEAEVSSDTDVSNDEDESDEECNEGFIDDRIEPTVATYVGEDPVDMMAIYRKSLLTQSPFGNEFNSWIRDTCPSVTPVDDLSSASGSEVWGLAITEKKCVLSCEDAMENPINESQIIVNDCGPSNSVAKLGDRKRRLSFKAEFLTHTKLQSGSESASFRNEFHKEFLGDRPDCKKRRIWELQEPEDLTDEFFVGLDLDALEAEAAQKARSHFTFNHRDSCCSQSYPVNIPNPVTPVPCQDTPSTAMCNSTCILPSFDLGIDG